MLVFDGDGCCVGMRSRVDTGIALYVMMQALCDILEHYTLQMNGHYSGEVIIKNMQDATTDTKCIQTYKCHIKRGEY